MSNTRFNRNFVLRLDEQDRTDLTRCIMREIDRVQAPADLGVEVDAGLLRRLRAMLDRLSD